MKKIQFAASLLALPLAFLLFAQWPLREWIGAYARQANDLGQICFALYAAVALSAATRAGVHLAAHAPAQQAKAPHTQRLMRWLLALCLAPWALFMLYSGWGSVWASVAGLEKFPETLSPGFFLIKLALLLMALLVLLDALWLLVRPKGRA